MAQCVVCGQTAFDALGHIREPVGRVIRRHAFCQQHWQDVAILLDELAQTMILGRTAADLALRLRAVEWPISELVPTTGEEVIDEHRD